MLVLEAGVACVCAALAPRLQHLAAEVYAGYASVTTAAAKYAVHTTGCVCWLNAGVGAAAVHGLTTATTRASAQHAH
jgi:hypothetical protein